MKYAGIGSRKTPRDILVLMTTFAYVFAKEATLRSGGAPGADVAFEFGATLGGGFKEIYLPWNGFNGCLNNAFLNEPTEAAMEIAAHYHPNWRYLKHGAKKLHGRNTHQILGKNLDHPADMVVCWTPDGSLDGTGSKVGGTGQALRIAYDYKIPIFNIQRPEHLEWVREAIGPNSFVVGLEGAPF